MAILYHYCSTATFHAMVTSRSLWLSSLSQSNDYMEGKHVARAVERLAKADNLKPSATKGIQDSIDLIHEIIDGLGFCLSEDGDLLSQWRGYAADATGVSVGFTDEYLNRLAGTSRSGQRGGFTLNKVEYLPEAHDALVAPTYVKVKQLIESGAFRVPGRTTLLDSRTDEEVEREDEIIRSANTRVSLTILSLFSELFLLKSPAFIEEREWRLISYLTKSGTDFCSHRSIDNQIVPYRAYDLLDAENGAISEVVLGPKHTSPVQVVRDFLRQSGFGDVKVVRSAATYR